jgi:predicted XRE-type DNA-binding protein
MMSTKSAKPLGVTQPRISYLMRDHIDLFSLDALVDMAQLAGLRAKVSVKVVERRSDSQAI